MFKQLYESVKQNRINESDERVKKTVTIEGRPEEIQELERLLSTLSYCCSAGASRKFDVWVDGDGAASIKVTGEGMAEPKSTDDDPIKFSFE